MAKSRHRSMKSSGSPRHTEKVGTGSAMGAGQVSAGGPGKAAMRVTPHMSAAQFEGGANSYKPGKMPTYSQE